MLEAKHIHIGLGGKDVLVDVSLCVNPGEIVGLVAPNGSGKSTLLTALVGRWGNLTTRTASGHLQADGVELSDAPTYHRQVVLVESGRAPLAASMRVRDQMGLVARRWGWSAGAVDRIATRCEMTDYLNKAPHRLSDGMARQAALALGYLTGARYLLLDEPFTSLDPTRVQLNEGVMRQLADQGCGLIVSSHALYEVDRLCDRVVFLKDGVAVEPHNKGSAQDTYQELFDSA